MNGLPVEAYLGRKPGRSPPSLETIHPLLEHVLSVGTAVNGVEFHRGQPGRDRSSPPTTVTAGGEVVGVGVVVEETTARAGGLRLRLLSEASETPRARSTTARRSTASRTCSRGSHRRVRDLDRRGRRPGPGGAGARRSVDRGADRALPKVYDLEDAAETPMVQAYLARRIDVWASIPDEVKRASPATRPTRT